jgi:hypothetical protein
MLVGRECGHAHVDGTSAVDGRQITEKLSYVKG